VNCLNDTVVQIPPVGIIYGASDNISGKSVDKRVKTAITVAVLVPLVVFAAYTMYELNGGSFDFSDSEMRIIITGSMDADPQPYDIPTIPVNSVVIIRHMSYDGWPTTWRSGT